jgi:hypothetical protein
LNLTLDEEKVIHCNLKEVNEYFNQIEKMPAVFILKKIKKKR